MYLNARQVLYKAGAESTILLGIEDEYLYVDLGSKQVFNIVPGVPETVSFTANIIRGGINYSF